MGAQPNKAIASQPSRAARSAQFSEGLRNLLQSSTNWRQRCRGCANGVEEAGATEIVEGPLGRTTEQGRCVPAQFIRALGPVFGGAQESLHELAPPMPGNVIRRTIRVETGDPLEPIVWRTRLAVALLIKSYIRATWRHSFRLRLEARTPSDALLFCRASDRHRAPDTFGRSASSVSDALPYQMPSYLSGTCSAGHPYNRGCSASSGECTGKAQNQPPAFSPLRW